MDAVTEQYDAYPYPERDPADEARRLITGSPSHPVEIDHFVFGGARDWSRPFRALVAGGGTGDALIQMAAVLAGAGRTFEITYLDLSRRARGVAEARAAARGLTGIEFVTGSLLDAPGMGPFDYIDCCGVLHHLSDPQEGFDALARALAPTGGMGIMVYAPHGRAGVYPLQDAFAALTAGQTPEARLATARAVFERVPDGHPFRRNPHLVDHEQGDAGFYDLLLHSRDTPFTIRRLLDTLAAVGLDHAGSPQAWLYALDGLLPDGVAVPEGLSDVGRMELAEQLRGTIKTHVLYAVPAGRDLRLPRPGDMSAVPHLKGVRGPDVARAVAARGQVRLTLATETRTLPLPKGAAPILSRVNGRRSLGDLCADARLDPLAFGALWTPVHRALTGAGAMLYSRLFT